MITGETTSSSAATTDVSTTVLLTTTVSTTNVPSTDVSTMVLLTTTVSPTSVPSTTGHTSYTTISTSKNEALTTRSGSGQTTSPNTTPSKNLTAIVSGTSIAGFLIIVALIAVTVFACVRRRPESGRPIISDEQDDEVPLVNDEYLKDVNSFLGMHSNEYYIHGSLKQRELGSRTQKRWYSEVCECQDSGDGALKKKLITVGPLSSTCVLKFDKPKYRNGINKLMLAIQKHPYLHPIEHVEVYTHKDEQLKDYRLLLMVQPFVESGSLKDMIYKTQPLRSWSNKYARKSDGLFTDKIKLYGRQILEAMKFLYSRGFPILGHVQTGNIFVVDNVCKLGGYENTLLGYKTRLYRLCKDNLEHLDIILFGHVIFEMAAGYELTQLRPTETDYTAVDSEVRDVLEYIFEEGFPHGISEILQHPFFSNVSLDSEAFDPNTIQLSDADVAAVLKKVRKSGSLPAGEGDEHRGKVGRFTFNLPTLKLPSIKNPFAKHKKERQYPDIEAVDPTPLLAGK